MSSKGGDDDNGESTSGRSRSTDDSLLDAIQQLFDVARGISRNGLSADGSRSKQDLEENMFDSLASPYTDLYGCHSTAFKSPLQSFVPLFHLVNSATREIPLYSPTNAHAFGNVAELEHLRNSRSYPSSTTDGRCVQTIAYNNFLHGNMRSQLSLLPYLLNSPYSPIFLKSQDEYQSKNQINTRRIPWHDAFTDLLCTSRGAPVTPFALFDTSIASPIYQSLWILALHQKGLLQSPNARSDSRTQTQWDWVCTNRPILAKVEAHQERRTLPLVSSSLDSPTNTPKNSAQTEQDMYDQLLQDFPESEVRPDHSGSYWNREQSKAPSMVKFGKDEEHMYLSSKTDFEPEHHDEHVRLHSYHSDYVNSVQQHINHEPSEVDDSKRVISTSRSVRSVTGPDGVRTTDTELITRYADGSESRECSSQTHEAVPATQAPRPAGDVEAAVRPKIERKRGWFWS